MRVEVLEIALIAGLATWAMRVLPLRADPGRLAAGGLLSRILGALGPSAIAALFVAEALPDLALPLSDQGPLAAGVLGTVAAFALTRSVVGATLLGAAAYGLALALLG